MDPIDPIKSDFTRITNPLRWKNLRHTLLKELEYLNQKGRNLSIIELGNGKGEHSAILETYGYKVLKTDIDTTVSPLLDEIIDIRKPLYFNDNTFDFLIAHHVLEHCPWEEVPGILQEFSRILKPSGVLSLALPMRRYWLELIIHLPRFHFRRGWFPFRKSHGRRGCHFWNVDRTVTPEVVEKRLTDNGFDVIEVSKEMDILFIAIPSKKKRHGK